MSQDELFINGEMLRLRREARGWVLNDMATRACMSVKQIRQLEEGGMSAFYSTAVKITAAKKVAALLGLSAEEVFAKAPDPEAEASSLHAVEVEASAPVAASHTMTIAPQEAATQHSAESTTTEPEVVASVSVDPASDDAAPKSKTSFLTIAVLFAVALAVAAYLQPKEEPPVEAAPPVQVLPNDATDPASAASAAESVASADAAGTASSPVVATKSASSASAGTAAAVAASMPRTAAPVANASTAARPASATVAMPAAAAASKAP